MRRGYFLSLLTLIVFVSAVNEIDPVFNKIENDLKSMELHGNVRKMTELTIVGKVIGRENQVGDTLYKDIYSFNDSGYLLNRISFDANLKLNLYYIYEYDDNGFKTCVTNYKLDSTFHGKSLFVYHAADTSIEERSYDEDRKYVCKNFVYYDSTGKIKKTMFHLFGDSPANIYTYSDSDRKVDIKNISTSHTNSVHYIERYNVRGELVMEATIINNKLESRYSYKHIYDAEGNWIIRYQIQDSDTLFTQYRFIDYY
ncbi:hypothetical protein SDC9_90971 [bioreactor metagenome]|uniref:Uncharacterized protein n=1 Tax=bioreactor metagenome TaxID=1076179 RepID=A0A645A0C5_9ZZZZ